MLILNDAREFTGDTSVVALGTFDGLHSGHRALIERTRDLARGAGALSAVLTFDRHPLSVISPCLAPTPLLGAERKRREIENMGIDVLVEQRFDSTFSSMSPEEFVDFLTSSMRPLALVAGYNYTFGAGGAGDGSALIRLAGRRGVKAHIIPKVSLGGRPISSSLIRELIAAGDHETAREMGYYRDDE